MHPSTMDATQREFVMQRRAALQRDLMPELQHQCGALTPRLKQLAHVPDWVRIEGWAMLARTGIGRQPHDRAIPRRTRIGTHLDLVRRS